MNMSLIITKGGYGAIDAGASSCHGYYIIIFSSYPYTIKSELNIDGQVIYSVKIVSEETCYFTIHFNSRYYGSPKINQITLLYLRGKLSMATLT